MMMRGLWMFLGGVLLAVTLGACTPDASEGGRYSVTVVNEHEHMFAPGEVSVGHLFMVGGQVVVEEGSEHRGPIYVLAGRLEVEGRVDGTLTVLGGEVALGDGAVITGDVQVAGGAVASSPAAVIEGRMTEENVTELFDTGPRGTVVGWLIWFVVSVVGMAVVAWLATALAPRITGRVAAAASGYPVVSGALGILVLIVVPALVASLIFTLFLIPLAVIIVVVLGLIALFGLVALARGIAGRMFPDRSPPTAAMMGTAGLVAVLQVISLLPLLGVLVLGLVFAVATGAVFLTGFGTRTYRPPEEWDGSEVAETPR